MLNLLRQFFRKQETVPVAKPEYQTTVIVSEATDVMVTRLGNAVDLVITVGGMVQETGATAEVKFTICDPETLRRISALLLNLVPRLEPPYYGEDDIGPLWEDEQAEIYEDIKYTIGEDMADEWLNSPNMHFGLKTPSEIIKSGKTYWVRQVLRSIRLGVFT